MYTPFKKSASINNLVMNPHQCFLPNKVVSNVENADPKVQKQAKAKRDGVINQPNYNFNKFLYGKF